MDSNSLNIGEDGAKEPTLMPIDNRYLLVVHIKCSCDSKRSRYLDLMWAKDLTEQFKYLKNFTLASPCVRETPPENTIEVDSETSFADAKFIDLPSANSESQSNIAAAGNGCPTLGGDRIFRYRTKRRSKLADSDGMVSDANSPDTTETIPGLSRVRTVAAATGHPCQH
ncbi:hypothetical protein [Microcoleus sp. OTE_8_concoct_300]|uniref:hypothetical protein n=1 Tax=Microcoleus sp. OTE_8_concoct_300 TaxID=2964710 RepID=UPI00403F60AA